MVNEARSSPGELLAARHWNCDRKQSTACPQKRPMFSVVGRHTTVPMSTDNAAFYGACRLTGCCPPRSCWNCSSTYEANPSAELPALYKEKQIQGLYQKSRSPSRQSKRVIKICFKTLHKCHSLILGCSYRASSVRIAIRLPTDATVYFVKYLFPLFLPYMFRALISPSSGVPQAVFLYTTIWFMWCLCCSSACACGLVCRGGFTVQ